TNPANNVTSGRAATMIPLFLCPSDSFQANPYTLPGPPVAFPSQIAAGAVAGTYSATSYAGNYGQGSYYTRFSQFTIKPNGIFFLTGPDPTLRTGLHPLADNHQSLPAVRPMMITDGTSTTLMIGEKYHRDDFFDTWTAANGSLKMHQVSAWAW